MIFSEKTVTLSDGRAAVFRSPTAADSEAMLTYLKTCSAETDFILRYPEECVETPEQEAEFLARINSSADGVMIVCEVDGELAGNCQIAFNSRLKTRHRASVAIGLVSKYWRLGIGSAMFREMIALAEDRGVTQVELDYIEGNDRARGLYEKMGFRVTGEKPDAIRLRDGTLLKEISMIRRL